MTHALRYLPDSPPPDDIVERNRHFARKWDAAWAAAKKEYLAGDTAKAVCRRHRLALSTFRYHAKIEGWRKCDAEGLMAPATLETASPPEPTSTPSPSDLIRGSDDPPAHPEPQDHRPHPADAKAPQTPALGSSPRATAEGVSEDPEHDPDPAYAALIGDARRHLAQAIRDGRPLDAQRWLKVMRELAPLAEEEAKDEVEEAFDAGVLIDLAGPMPFAKLSDDQILYAARALRRTIDSRQAKQRTERARKSATKLDSPEERTLDSTPPATTDQTSPLTFSSPPCSSRGPIPSEPTDDPQTDDPERMDARNQSGHDEAGAHRPHPADAEAPQPPDERDEINGFYRSRPTALG